MLAARASLRAALRSCAHAPYRPPTAVHLHLRGLTSSPAPKRTTTTTTTTTSTQPAAATTSAAPALPVDGLPRYPDLSTLGVLRGLDYLGTVSFAHSGALLAALSGMDVLGATVVGTITAVGGGTIRDAVVLARRPFWTDETEYLYLSAAAALATFALWPHDRLDDSLPHFVSDALGVAAFCVIGAQNGVRARVAVPVVVICGVATATFGGAVRDVLCKRDVRILHSHAEVYASTAAAGAAAYLVARRARVGVASRVGAGLAVAFAARCYAWAYGTRLPIWTRESPSGAGEQKAEKAA